MNTKFKLHPIPSYPLVIITIISVYALLILYSIGSGKFFPWCISQICKLFVGFVALIIASNIPLKFWRRYAYYLYIFCLVMLIAVSILGKVSMGAQRWLNLYIINFQPSELMRIALVLSLAKYFNNLTILDIKKTYTLTIPLMITMVPVLLVLLQPDLGTAMLLVSVFMSILFVCGVQIWKFIVVFCTSIVSAPIMWSMLHEYQKKRILMFLSPELDPMGAGYHIIQSKIALGSGGFWGKGLMHGTQCQLNFLPEKQTDFIFAALGEELGFLGCSLLLFLYTILLIYNFSVALRARSRFNQIMIFGLSAMMFFYIFINTSMVCGLLPVVGIPLPFFSYGGSALVVLMICQGLIFAADIEQKKNSGIKNNNYHY